MSLRQIWTLHLRPSLKVKFSYTDEIVGLGWKRFLETWIWYACIMRETGDGWPLEWGLTSAALEFVFNSRIDASGKYELDFQWN